MTTTAIATRDSSPSALIKDYTEDFRTVLPTTIRAETFVRLAQGVLRRDPKLMEAANSNPGSLFVALLDAARLGHEPGTEDFYLTPRKRKGKPEVLGIEGYRGIVKRMLNSGIVQSVVAEVVTKEEWESGAFQFVRGEMDRPVHRIDFFAEAGRGTLIGSYAYAVMAGGATSQVIVCGPEEIRAARASSSGADYPDSPWKKHPSSMYRKTALRRLEPFVAKSSIYSGTQLDRTVQAEQVVSDRDLPALPAYDPATGELQDDEPVDAVLVHKYAGDGAECTECGEPVDAEAHA